MKNTVGYLLKELREDASRTMQNTARGIINQSDLSKLESGEKDVEYLALEALFETLGKCIDKLELAVTQEEYELLQLREDIVDGLEQGNFLEVDRLILLYQKKANCRKPLHEQYIKQVQALNNYQKNQDKQQVLHALEEALKITCMGYRENDIYFFHQEIRLLYLIAYLKYECSQWQEALAIAKKVMQYLNHSYTDEEAKVKVYPQCSWLIGQILYEQKEYERADDFVEKGLECLRVNGALHWMDELISLKIACMKKLNRKAELDEYGRYHAAMHMLYETAGMKFPEFSIIRFLKSNTQRECVISNQFLRNLREAEGVTQEELCEDVCAWETISRIESGRNPNKKKLYQMWKRLGVEREHYYGFIESEHYAIYEKVREYNRLIGKRDVKHAEEVFCEMKDGLDLSCILNRQFVGCAEIVNKIMQNKLSEEEAIDQLWGLLSLTMPPIEEAERIYRLPFRTEFFILNQIARRLHEMGKTRESVKIYQQVLKKYKSNGTDLKYHVVPMILLYLNCAAHLEENDQLKEAEAVALEGLKFAISCQRGDTAGKIIANMSCIYEKRKQEITEKRYLRNAYYLNVLYHHEKLADTLKQAYEQKFYEKLY